jgi:hypothetical protein
MYTDKAVALRGKKSMKFDYEFESFKLENRVFKGVFEKRVRRAGKKSSMKRVPRKRAARKSRARKPLLKKGK